MPGAYDWHLAGRCPDCDGRADPWITGRFFHKPTCPTQPGHAEAQRLADEARLERRAYIDRLVASDEARRLRELRSIGRVGA